MITAFLLLAAPVVMNAQNKLITGKVTDDHNGTLPGVTVTIKGTQKGTLTDSDGKYSIKVNATDILVYSFMGYESSTLAVGNKSVINISLKSSTTGLEEVVVVGYGTIKRKDITGSVSNVAVNEIQMAPVRSIDEALAGRAAGVQVTSSDGQPGASTNIVIRGNNSVTQNNSPLYVIDGFLIENPDNNIINPNDVESINILKDASATAIYGARGANGVIVITTKKGKKGAPVFNFDTSYGFQENLKTMDLMDPYEFVKYQIELDPTPVSGNAYKSPTQVYLTDGKTLDYYKTVEGIDWQDKVTETAPIKNYNLSIRGGNENTKYAFSGSVTDQDGIIINSNYKRYQGRLVVDQNLSKKVKIGINTNYSHLEQSGASPSISTASATTNIMVSVWGSRPVYNGEVSDDQLQDPDVNPANDYRVNPYLNLQNLYRLKTTNNLNSNAYLEYLILPELKFRTSSGIIENRVENDLFNNSQTQYGYPGSANGINGSIQYSQFSNWLNENTLTWNKKFNKKHTINAVGGFTIQKQKSKTYGTSANQIPADKEDLGLDGLQYGTQLRVDTFESLWSMASFLARVNYNYASKYYFTASMRADGSSKFPTENHWGYFPSAALSWTFKNEKFLKNSKILSDGKIRTSYGKTGNNRVGDFDYLTIYYNPISNSYVFNNQYVSGTVATNLGNSKLKWETTEQKDIGLDLGFLKQRITLSIDAYSKKTIDLLLSANLPLSSGFSTALKNVGQMQNQGLEFTLDTKNIDTKNFSWTSSFNISFNKSKVLALNDNQTNLQSSIPWDNIWQNVPAYIAKVGSPLGEMYGYISDGTYKYDDFNNNNGIYTLKPEITTNGNTRANIQPGDIKYKDLNGDGVVNSSDYTVIGHGLPKNTGGFSNNFRYKGFDLNVFFQWSYGNDILNANRILFEGNTKSLTYFNQFASYENRWTPENPNSDIFRTKGFYGGGYSSQFVEDGSYLRLKTVSFGYNLDTNFLRKMHLKAMRVYCSGQNLATWTKYSGGDPEVNTYNSALTSGFDFSAYPRARVISFGTNISF
ncbi:SusC/RagA family TonB-linked outer membrane protein [Flavobacterium limnophilum]|uniref:SusC/RagA family TonB-linked outer membrane protein n=1 Tax=Flavobacterium limnophilum TaxID=3003262 RepID=UPI002482C20A|nr:TonB-dependent receptor [Flavobacterium limnophilum]